MQTTTQPTNFALFVALLLIATLVGLLGAYLAPGQVVDGDLTYWRYDETDQLSFSTCLFEAIEGRGVAAVGPEQVSTFDGEGWSYFADSVVYLSNAVQGPDGKIWFRETPQNRIGCGFWDENGDTHHTQFGGGLSQDGWALEMERWRGNYGFMFGVLPFVSGGWINAYSYCKPSCSNMDGITGFNGPPDPESDYRDYYAVSVCRVSGDYLLLLSSGPPKVVNLLARQESWILDDFDSLSVSGACVGGNSYFWIEVQEHRGVIGPLKPVGTMQVDAVNRTVEEIPWLDRIPIAALAWDWHGLWVFWGGSFGDNERMPLGVAFWSLQDATPDVSRLLPDQAGSDSARPGGGIGRLIPFGMQRMAVDNGPSLWFATDEAVVKWSPDPDLIPMPYEARVEAQAKEGGSVEVEIEFDNLRIIRNDATLHLKIEYFAEGQQEPLPGALTFYVYHEFQPQETFYYSFEYVPVLPPSDDRIRYSVYTTDIDLNAPPTDDPIITSNVATAEVRLD